MSMHALRGLEMTCLTKGGHFELGYAGKNSYTDAAGEPVEDLMDMGCVGCGNRYFTRETGGIDFCPACGFMERKRFNSYQELQKWSNEQSWAYLKITGMEAFGVLRNADWRLTFATDEVTLEMKGVYEEIHALVR